MAKRGLASVATSWDRLHRWFDRHLPEVGADLLPGASDADIAAFERTTRRTLPEDVRASLRIHDGQRSPCKTDGCIYGLGLMSLEHILDVWEGHRTSPNDGAAGEKPSYPAGAVQSCDSHPGWIPLTFDWGFSYLGVDLAPGLQGSWGQVIVFGYPEHRRFVTAESWRSFLAEYYSGLRAGNFRIDRQAEGRLTFE